MVGEPVTHAAATTSVTEVVCCTAPAVPVTVSAKLPAGVDDAVDTVSVDVPDPPPIDDGLNAAVAPAGSPLTARPTVAANPFAGEAVIA